MTSEKATTDQPFDGRRSPREIAAVMRKLATTPVPCARAGCASLASRVAHDDALVCATHALGRGDWRADLDRKRRTLNAHR